MTALTESLLSALEQNALAQIDGAYLLEMNSWDERICPLCEGEDSEEDFLHENHCLLLWIHQLVTERDSARESAAAPPLCNGWRHIDTWAKDHEGQCLFVDRNGFQQTDDFPVRPYVAWRPIPPGPFDAAPADPGSGWRA